jgi:transposase
VLGGKIGVVFYDVTTLYFETDFADELYKTGPLKEGKHAQPQVVLGLLVSDGGYPLAYSIHEGNKYEGHTTCCQGFCKKKFDLKDFVVVADSGLINAENIAELEKELAHPQNPVSSINVSESKKEEFDIRNSS